MQSNVVLKAFSSRFTYRCSPWFFIGSYMYVCAQGFILGPLLIPISVYLCGIDKNIKY